MKITAVYNVQVEGFGIVKRGRTIDIDESLVDDRIAANFKRADGTPLKAAQGNAEAKTDADPGKTEEDRVAKAVQVIGREGIMRKLDEMGVTYKPTHKTEYLAKLLLETQGEI